MKSPRFLALAHCFSVPAPTFHARWASPRIRQNSKTPFSRCCERARRTKSPAPSRPARPTRWGGGGEKDGRSFGRRCLQSLLAARSSVNGSNKEITHVIAGGAAGARGVAAALHG